MEIGIAADPIDLMMDESAKHSIGRGGGNRHDDATVSALENLKELATDVNTRNTCHDTGSN